MLPLIVPPTEVEFTTENEKKEFIKNLESLPDDWEYRKKKFTYKYNSWGHRSIEPNELIDNYILFTGCSFTEGIGLPEEYTYPYMVSKYLGKSYYNMAKRGAGPDFVAINLISFLCAMGDKKPNTIVIQWPQQNRFFKYSGTRFDAPTFYLPTISYENYPEENVNLYRWMVETDSITHTNNFYRHWLMSCLIHMKIKNIYEFSYDNLDIISGNEKTKITKVDISFPFNVSDYKSLARDLSHPGHSAHLAQAKILLGHIT